MTTPPALDWLQAELDQAIRHRPWRSADRRDDPRWHGGPSVIRPMIQLRPITDAGEPMKVTYADYHDPERWWL
jgi:hypothetical protein